MTLFLIWRLKQLIKEGKVEMQGDIKSMKEYEVRLPGDTVMLNEEKYSTGNFQ